MDDLLPLPEFPPGLVAVLATVGPRGPVAIPVSALLRCGAHELLLALAGRRGSLARLRDEPRVALSLSGPGFCLAVEGEARVEADPLPGAENMVGVRVRADVVRDTCGPSTAVDAGIRWRWTTGESETRHRRVLAALAALETHPNG